MSPRVDHLPAGTRAEILRAVAREKHPKLALGAIAGRFSVTYDDLRVIIEKAGYPDPARMLAFAVELDEQEAGDQAAPDLQAVPETPDAPEPVEVPLAGDDEPHRLVKVPLDQLHPDPDNPRELPHVDDVDIVELADSMLEVGLVQPVVARRGPGGRLIIVAGHRRLTAARRLRWSSIDTIVRGAMPADDVIAAMLIENGQRRDLNPLEEARGLKFLQTTMGDCSDAALAQRVGRTQVYVSGRLALLSLSAEDQAAIRAGRMNISDGIRRGRLASGKVRAGSTGSPHLGVDNDLAHQVRARCHRLGHKGRGRNSVGGVGCGECWESVIRADERAHLHEVNAKLGECVTCGQPVEKAADTAGVAS